MRKITEEEFDRVVLKEKERQKFRGHHKRSKDTPEERPQSYSADLATLVDPVIEKCASERLHIHCHYTDNIQNITNAYDDRLEVCQKYATLAQSASVKRMYVPTDHLLQCSSSIGEVATTLSNRQTKRLSKTLHKTKHATLLQKKIANSADSDGGNTDYTGVEATKSSKGLMGNTFGASFLAFQSAKPTAYSVAQKKQDRSDKVQCDSCNFLNCYQPNPTPCPGLSVVNNSTRIYQSIPPKFSAVSKTGIKFHHYQNSSQEKAYSSAKVTRKRLKNPDLSCCSEDSGSTFPKSFIGVKSLLNILCQKCSKEWCWSYGSIPARLRHSTSNFSKVLLILIMLISLVPVVCGHNVNLNSSDKIPAPPKQQHMHQQYHHEPHHDGASSNGNNIHREMNSRFSNFGNGFTSSTDDTVLTDDSGESSRRFVGEDTLGMSSIGGTTDEGIGGSTTFVRSGCHSCQMREKVKADNLASIKRHILYRLKLKDVPNITAPVVPPEIVEKFYKSHYQNGGANNNGGKKNNGANSGGSVGDRGGRNRSGSGNGDSRNRYSDENTGGGGGSGARYSSTFYDNMQGDDPRAYYDANYDGSDSSDNLANGQYRGFDSDSTDGGDGDEEDYEEDFFSIVNSIYVFPTTQHPRHNRKTDILHFPLTSNGHSTVSQATLHIFLRSWSWVRENFDSSFSGSASSSGSHQQQQHGSSNSMPSNAVNRNLDVVLRISNVLRHNNATNSQKGNELRYRIPRSDNGVWITVDVTEMVTEWYSNASTNHGVVIKTKESWMKHFVVLDDSIANKTFAPYIEVMTKDNRKRRSKRNTSLNCLESDNEIRCCRYPLEVNFKQFNWEWIIAPQSFNAYFCNGECKLGFLQKYPHTHLMQMSTAPQPCCSPTKMSPVTLLYFNTEHILVMSTIPNMAVDKCSCS